MIRKYQLALFTALFLFFTSVALSAVFAAVVSERTSVMGMHLMNVGELEEVKPLISHGSDEETWQYVTIPFILSDVEKADEWQEFFDDARELQIIPLVRLASRYDPDSDSWIVPTRRDITRQIEVLSALDWPTKHRHVMVFNEVNHAKEWENEIAPAEYAQVFLFTSQWLHSEQKNYVVLPAAMDLAAPNGPVTREAFAYLEEMRAAQPDVFEHMDAINSHSYPNPGFSSDPYRTGQNSLRGFEFEIAYFKEHTNKDFPVYITETGWEDNARTRYRLHEYYEYALENIWSHSQVVAVTPFIFRGDPGPFSGFSFVKGDGTPTRQYSALEQALGRVLGSEDQWLSQSE
ncbi:MAG: glycosyl hydrolase [Patescibacteria group bacterium]